MMGEGEEERGWEKKSGRKKEKEIVVYGHGYLWTQEQREEKILKENGGKEGRKKEAFPFTLSPVIAGPGRHLYSTRRKC